MTSGIGIKDLTAIIFGDNNQTSKNDRVHKTQTVTQSSSFRILLHFIFYI